MSDREEVEELSPAEGKRRQDRDRALATFDEEEVRGRLLGAMAELLQFGFGVELLASPIRDAVEYRLRLAHDGSGERPVRTVQAVADRFNLDLVVSSEVGNRLVLILYPRG